MSEQRRDRRGIETGQVLGLPVVATAFRLGRIEQVGSPLELYNAPRNLFVAGFMGSPRMNFLKATIRSADAAGVEVAIGGGTLVRVPRDGRKGRQLRSLQPAQLCVCG